MTAAVPALRAPSTVARWLRWVLAGMATATVAVVAFVAVSGDGRDAERTRADATAYREALRPLVEDGGRVVAMGLRPGMTDIREQRYSTSVLEGMAATWVSELRSVRSDVAAVEHPDFLDDIHATYLEAIDGYVRAASAMGEAVAAEGEARQALLDKAAALGEKADQTYDRADRALARLER